MAGRGGQPIAQQEPPAHCVYVFIATLAARADKGDSWSPCRFSAGSGRTNYLGNSKNVPRAGVVLQGPAA